MMPNISIPRAARRELVLAGAMFSPVLICLLVMAPRLADARFGLFDDAETLETSRAIVAGGWDTPEASQGRFRPTYWLYLAATYAVVGADPFGFFAGNALAFAGITASLVAVVRLYGGSRLQSWGAGFFFALSGPTIESFYTLSKAEPPQVLLLLLSLLALALSAHRRSRYASGLALILGGVLVLLAMGCKETTLVIIPVGVAWLLLGGGPALTADHARSLRWYGVATILAGCTYLALRSGFATASLGAGTYSDEFVVSAERIIASGVRWAGLLVRDFPLVCFFAILWVSQLLRRKKLAGAPILFGSVIWMVGWVLVFLPWPHTLEYYALPFSAGSSAFSGVILGNALASRSFQRFIERVELTAILAVVIASLIATGANNATSARLQLAVDAANGEMVDYLATHVPPNGTVTVNLPGEFEYVKKLGRLLSQWKARGDIEVSPFSFQTTNEMPSGVASYLVVAPYIVNQPALSVRLGVDEVGCRRWNQALEGFLGGGATPVASVSRTFALSNVEFIRPLCNVIPFGHYCASAGSLIDTRPLSYGWDIYRVNVDPRSTATPAVFRFDRTWLFEWEGSMPVEVAFGREGDIPLVGDWDGNGYTDVGFYRPSDQTWRLDTEIDGRADIELKFVGMTAGDIPLAGDWDGDGVTSPGFFRPVDTSWHFMNRLSTGGEDLPVVHGGNPTDVPLVGDWNGDGMYSIGVYRPLLGEVDLEDGLEVASSGSDFPAPKGAIPVAGPWGGQGFDSLAFVKDGVWYRQFSNCDCLPSNEPRALEFGGPRDVPRAGVWRLAR